LTYSGLDYFNPQSVTPDINVHESTGTIIHRLAIGNGLMQNTLAITRVSTGICEQNQKRHLKLQACSRNPETVISNTSH
jgi:hypothetical protein